MSAPTRPQDVPQTAPAPESPPPTAITPPRGSVAARALLAVAVLVGYFALVAAVVGLLGTVTVLAFTSGVGGYVSVKLALFTGIVALAVLRAVFAVERRGDDAPDGVPLTREEQPELWGLVDEASRQLSVPPPDHLWLVDDVNAYVRQETRLLGLVGGRRHMGIGAALLQVLTVDQLRTVIGHELGHYAGGDTRLGALVYRAGVTIGSTAGNLGRSTLLGRLFVRYERLFQRVSLAVRRRQELRADAGAVAAGGRAVHASALREGQAGAMAWQFFLDRYVMPLWEAGTAPADLYDGFRSLLADPVRQQQLDGARAADGGPADPYDSHPALSVRLAHVQGLPDRPAPGDDRPARVLLRDAEVLERRVTEDVNERVLRELPADRYSFAAEPLDATPYLGGVGDDAVELSRATAAVDGRGAPAGLGRTLALLESRRDDRLWAALTGEEPEHDPQVRAQDVQDVVRGPVAWAAACGLVTAGGAHWRLTWSRGVVLVDEQGAELELAEQLAQVLAERGVAGLRSALTEAGVPLADEVVPAGAVPPDPADELVAVWPDLAARRRTRVDAFATAELLVLVPRTQPWPEGLRRGLAQGVGPGRGGLRTAAVERARAVLRDPLSEVGRRPGVHTVRWADLPSVQLKDSMGVAWVLKLASQPALFSRLTADDPGLVAPAAQTAEVLRQLVGDRLRSKR